MDIPKILEQQRLEKYLRKNPGQTYPGILPQEVRDEFALVNNSKEVITFIIPFKGESRIHHLKKCIENLIKRYPTCEIIIIEEDKTPSIKEPIKHVRYIFVYSKQLFNKALCFNIGFLTAANNIICGIDCDMIIPSTLIDKNIECVNQDKVVFPGKNIYYMFQNFDIDNIENRAWNLETWNEKNNWHFHGGIFLCNKKIYAKVGGFDQRFIGHGSEDTNFFMRCTETYNAIVCDNISMLHLNHEYDQIDYKAQDFNKGLLHILSRISPNDRITDCKLYNIFHT